MKKNSRKCTKKEHMHFHHKTNLHVLIEGNCNDLSQEYKAIVT